VGQRPPELLGNLLCARDMPQSLVDFTGWMYAPMVGVGNNLRDDPKRGADSLNLDDGDPA
jgi:hypothetical protein